MSLGIQVVRSRPGKPQDNGAHERMHADICIEIQRDAARTLRAQQRVCDAWRDEFNFVRPHEALGQRTPAEVYEPSARRPGEILIGGFPEGCSMMRVSKYGKAYHAGTWIFIGAALSTHQVGFQPDADGMLVWFFDLLLGRFVPGDYSLSPYELPTRNPPIAGPSTNLSPPTVGTVTPERPAEVTGVTLSTGENPLPLPTALPEAVAQV